MVNRFAMSFSVNSCGAQMPSFCTSPIECKRLLTVDLSTCIYVPEVFDIDLDRSILPILRLRIFLADLNVLCLED